VEYNADATQITQWNKIQSIFDRRDNLERLQARDTVCHILWEFHLSGKFTRILFPPIYRSSTEGIVSKGNAWRLHGSFISAIRSVCCGVNYALPWPALYWAFSPPFQFGLSAVVSICNAMACSKSDHSATLINKDPAKYTPLGVFWPC
jgi:hypothetical protein